MVHREINYSLRRNLKPIELEKQVQNIMFAYQKELDEFYSTVFEMDQNHQVKLNDDVEYDDKIEIQTYRKDGKEYKRTVRIPQYEENGMRKTKWVKRVGFLSNDVQKEFNSLNGNSYSMDVLTHQYYNNRHQASTLSNLEVPAEGETPITPHQQEQLRTFQKWLFKHAGDQGVKGLRAIKGAGKMQGLVNDFVSQPPRVQLYCLYILEHGENSGWKKDDYNQLIDSQDENYTVDMNKIRKVMQTHWNPFARPFGFKFHHKKLAMALATAKSHLEDFKVLGKSLKQNQEIVAAAKREQQNANFLQPDANVINQATRLKSTKTILEENKINKTEEKLDQLMKDGLRVYRSHLLISAPDFKPEDIPEMTPAMIKTEKVRINMDMLSLKSDIIQTMAELQKVSPERFHQWQDRHVFYSVANPDHLPTDTKAFHEYLTQDQEEVQMIYEEQPAHLKVAQPEPEEPMDFFDAAEEVQDGISDSLWGLNKYQTIKGAIDGIMKIKSGDEDAAIFNIAKSLGGENFKTEFKDALDKAYSSLLIGKDYVSTTATVLGIINTIGEARNLPTMGKMEIAEWVAGAADNVGSLAWNAEAWSNWMLKASNAQLFSEKATQAFGEVMDTVGASTQIFSTAISAAKAYGSYRTYKARNELVGEMEANKRKENLDKTKDQLDQAIKANENKTDVKSVRANAFRSYASDNTSYLSGNVQKADGIVNLSAKKAKREMVRNILDAVGDGSSLATTLMLSAATGGTGLVVNGVLLGVNTYLNHMNELHNERDCIDFDISNKWIAEHPEDKNMTHDDLRNQMKAFGRSRLDLYKNTQFGFNKKTTLKLQKLAQTQSSSDQSVLDGERKRHVAQNGFNNMKTMTDDINKKNAELMYKLAFSGNLRGDALSKDNLITNETKDAFLGKEGDMANWTDEQLIRRVTLKLLKTGSGKVEHFDAKDVEKALETTVASQMKFVK